MRLEYNVQLIYQLNCSRQNTLCRVIPRSAIYHLPVDSLSFVVVGVSLAPSSPLHLLNHHLLSYPHRGRRCCPPLQGAICLLIAEAAPFQRQYGERQDVLCGFSTSRITAHVLLFLAQWQRWRIGELKRRGWLHMATTSFATDTKTIYLKVCECGFEKNEMMVTSGRVECVAEA